MNYIIHAGVDIIDIELIDHFPSRGSMEETVFVHLAKTKQFALYLPEKDFFWMSIDTHKDFHNANEIWPGLK